MRQLRLTGYACFLLGSLGLALHADETQPAGARPIPRFRAEEIDRSLKVGYAVALVDLNADGKKDIVVVDTTRLVWFENPTWKMRTIIQNQTKPDNVCLDVADIDGDGALDIALGAEWRPFNTKDGGTLQWLKRGKTLDELWTVYPIDTEPTIHRIRFADLDGDKRPELIVGPLMGRNATQAKNWMDAPLRITAYRIPRDPTRDRWTPTVLDESLHVMHNFQPVDLDRDGRPEILTASYEGVHLLTQGASGSWTRKLLNEGNQTRPQSNRGASEIKLGRFKGGEPYIATIEPWHGNQVVVYTPPREPGDQHWERTVLDEKLKWGHAVWCADLDGDGDEELVIGVRDKLSDADQSGVRIYKAADPRWRKWERAVIDNGTVAVEDLAVADLNGDGRPDIVAVGRATGNVKIFWNEGAR